MTSICSSLTHGAHRSHFWAGAPGSSTLHGPLLGLRGHALSHAPAPGAGLLATDCLTASALPSCSPTWAPRPPVLPPAQPARAACPVSGTQGRGLAARGVLRGIALGLMRLSFSRVFYTCSFSCVCSSFMPICDWGYLLKLHVFFMYMYVRVCVHTYVCIVQVQILFQYRYCNIFSLSVACLPVYFF